MDLTQEQIGLYKSLFQGRDDAYARRWEKDTKSGWSPAYSFDWSEFNAHRAHGGTIKDFKKRRSFRLLLVCSSKKLDVFI